MNENPLKRIEMLLKKNGLSMKEVSLAAGKSETFVRDVLKRGRSPSIDNLRAVERAIAELTGEEIEEGRNKATLPYGIPNLDIHAGLGNGGLGHIEVDPATLRPLDHYTDGDWIFPQSIQSRIGVLKGKYAFPVEGDSMSPTIVGGSIVFVDSQRTHPNPPGLFVVDTGDGRLVKRIELIPRTEQIKVISDNKEYGSYVHHRDEVQVFGRVIAVFSWNE